MIADFILEELKKIGLMFCYGIGMSVVYDIFRILRRIIPHNKVAVSSEDLFYWLCMSVPTFYFIVYVNDGIFRLYFIIGIIMGIIIYRETVGRLVFMIVTFLVNKIIKFIIFILKKVLKSFKIRLDKLRPKKRS